MLKTGNVFNILNAGLETQRVFLKEEPKNIRLVKELRNLDGSYVDK